LTVLIEILASRVLSIITNRVLGFANDTFWLRGRIHITIGLMHAQTQRQREVFEFITRYIDSHGYRPSYQVIARQTGVRSRSGIARIVRDLESQGLLTRRRENGHFYLDVGHSNGEGNGNSSAVIEWLDVPELGSGPEPWQSEPFVVPAFMLGLQEPGRVKAYLVGDNAMNGENICEGDIALIEIRQFARDGEPVVAVIEGSSSVLRKYYRQWSEIELRASDISPAPGTIRTLADRVEIKGVFRGLLRTKI
jgi:repressor LexA